MVVFEVGIHGPRHAALKHFLYYHHKKKGGGGGQHATHALPDGKDICKYTNYILWKQFHALFKRSSGTLEQQKKVL